MGVFGLYLVLVRKDKMVKEEPEEPEEVVVAANPVLVFLQEVLEMAAAAAEEVVKAEKVDKVEDLVEHLFPFIFSIMVLMVF